MMFVSRRRCPATAADGHGLTPPWRQVDVPGPSEPALLPGESYDHDSYLSGWAPTGCARTNGVHAFRRYRVAIVVAQRHPAEAACFSEDALAVSPVQAEEVACPRSAI